MAIGLAVAMLWLALPVAAENVCTRGGGVIPGVQSKRECQDMGGKWGPRKEMKTPKKKNPKPGR